MRCVIKYILKQIWSSEDVTKECSCLKLMQFSLAQANSWSVLQLFKWMNIFLMEVILIVSPRLIAFMWICLPRQGLSLKSINILSLNKETRGNVYKKCCFTNQQGKRAQMSQSYDKKCHQDLMVTAVRLLTVSPQYMLCRATDCTNMGKHFPWNLCGWRLSRGLLVCIVSIMGKIVADFITWWWWCLDGI